MLARPLLPGLMTWQPFENQATVSAYKNDARLRAHFLNRSRYSRLDPERVAAAVAGRGEEKILAVARDVGPVLRAGGVDLRAQMDWAIPTRRPCPLKAI